MIATILPSTSSFHAVNYNEHKVTKGVASLLEIKNFGDLDTLGYQSPGQLVEYLKEYSAANARIKNAQFHVAISCKGHEMTEQQLVDFAHEYLKAMGYGKPGQPVLIYAHRDTDNTHIHIVTSRVDPNGKKINDSNERRRSQKVIEKLMGKNVKKSAENDLIEAMKFDFRSISQFKAVLEAMGYECYEKDDKIYIKKGGVVQSDIDKSIIERLIAQNKQKPQDNSDYMKWKSIFKKYRDLNSSKAGLESELRTKFGLAIVWFGRKDSPYGYAVVDFNKKKVMEGGKILSVKNLLDFRSPEEHAAAIETFIDKCMEETPLITTFELNKKLKRLGGCVKKDQFIFGNRRQLLNPLVSEKLKRNNKIYNIESFHPASEAERDLLCVLNKFNAPDMIHITPSVDQYKPTEVSKLESVFNIDDGAEIESRLESEGWRLFKTDAGTFVYNRTLKSIVDMSKTDIPSFKYDGLSTSISTSRQNSDHSHSSRIYNSKVDKKQSGGSVSQSQLKNNVGNIRMPRTNNPKGPSDNREWEVGKKGYDPDDMDNQNRGVGY